MKKELKKVGIKVIKTMAESAIAFIGTSTFIQEVHWSAVLSGVLLSGVLTVLFNLKDLKEE